MTLDHWTKASYGNDSLSGILKGSLSHSFPDRVEWCLFHLFFSLKGVSVFSDSFLSFDCLPACLKLDTFQPFSIETLICICCYLENVSKCDYASQLSSSSIQLRFGVLESFPMDFSNLSSILCFVCEYSPLTNVPLRAVVYSLDNIVSVAAKLLNPIVKPVAHPRMIKDQINPRFRYRVTDPSDLQFLPFFLVQTAAVEPRLDRSDHKC